MLDRTRRGGVALLAAALAACTHDDGAVDALAGSGLPGVTVDTAPVLVLADDGTPEKLFQHVSARRLPDGRVAVADHGALTINVFRPDGAFDTTLARRGGGPGELRGDFHLAARADTLFVLGRPMMSPADVNVFVARGGFLRRFRPEVDNAPTGLTLHDRLATGQFFVERGREFRVITRAPEQGRLIPDSISYGLLPTDAEGRTGGHVTWLPPVVRWWQFAYPWPNGPMPTAAARYPFAPRTLAVASGDRLWLIDTDSGRLRAFDGTGRQVVDARLTLEPAPLDAAALDRRRARELAAARRALDSSRVRAQYDPELLPARAPLVAEARAGADGELWLRLFDVDDAVAPRYVIVDREGRAIARATLPAGLDVQQIGRDFVLGVRRDSLDVERVVEYGLRRP
ncbi:MAG TPA: hypothetical protein VFS08_00885 [Gemmatimonadaceae bacterium]|nr:hypothetical protein [Gemmatimonadaceae bacterium]